MLRGLGLISGGGYRSNRRWETLGERVLNPAYPKAKEDHSSKYSNRQNRAFPLSSLSLRQDLRAQAGLNLPM